MTKIGIYRKHIGLARLSVLVAANILLAGCGKTEGGSQQADIEKQAVADSAQMQKPSAEESPQTQEPSAEESILTQEQAYEDGSRAQEEGIVSRKTQAEYDEEDLAQRAMFEEKVKEAEGISEEEAVEIAQKALAADLGGDGEELELSINERFGWKSDLCIADWSEIKEEDRGAIAYWINFNNGKKVEDFEDLVNYNCTVNAVDGHILEAYSSEGLDGKPVYYDH